MSRSSCSAVAFAATGAFAFTFVPSPATTSTLTRPCFAHATSEATSSPFTAFSWRDTNRATVAWSGCRFPQITRAPTSSKVAISTAREDRIPMQ